MSTRAPAEIRLADPKDEVIAQLTRERDELARNILILAAEIDGDWIVTCETCGAFMTIEEKASVADVTMCPKLAYGGDRLPNEKCFSQEAGRMAVTEAHKAAVAEFWARNPQPARKK